jgi:hypothetical protein
MALCRYLIACKSNAIVGMQQVKARLPQSSEQCALDHIFRLWVSVYIRDSEVALL